MSTLNKLKIKENKSPFEGRFTMRTHEAGEIKWHRDEETGKVICDIPSLRAAMGKPRYQHPEVENLVVSSTGGYGRNLILRKMMNDNSYGIVVDSAKIGTGNTTPVDGDTDIEVGVLSGITIQTYELVNDVLTLTLFIPDVDLANGTYREFTLHIGGRLFCRALILPTYSKSTNEDTTVEYTISLSAL